MDKRFTPLSLAEQLELRMKAVEDVLAHPEWTLAQSVRHMKKTMRLTTAEMAKLSGVAFRTIQDIEQERSEGSVQTMNRILGMLGLKLGVARATREPASPSSGDQDGADEPHRL
jgi:DNA-binding XRE family transcriptional regulator